MVKRLAKVLILQNDATEDLGLYEGVLRHRNEVTVLHIYKIAEKLVFPDPTDYSHFIVGPTPIPANEANNHLKIKLEVDYLRRLIRYRKPILGVCCGGQILSLLLGGEVIRSPKKEVGGYTVRLTEDGRRDPLYQGFPQSFPVFHWHNDMFMVPPNGQLLVMGDPCPVQSFGLDKVYGVIFHLEVSSKDAARWAKEYPDEPNSIGKTANQVVDECHKNEKEMKKLAIQLMENFISIK